MKIVGRKILKLSVFLSLFMLFGQTVFSQGKHCGWELSFDEILSKFTSRRTISAEPVNKELINEISKRKVGFELNAANEKTLRDAGASDLLLTTISENLLREVVEAKFLYDIYINNFQSNKVEELKIAVEAAREFVSKFENDSCYLEQVEYYKDAIQLLEKDPRLKTDDKWKIIRLVEERYRSKNWSEVFALGEKVLEIDPDFLPMAIFLASLGYDLEQKQEYENLYKKETARYAAIAIKLLQSGKHSGNTYGAFEYSFRTKSEALSKMREIFEEINR